MHHMRDSKHGFTLIELMTAVVVVGIIFIGLFAGLIQVYNEANYRNVQLALDAGAQTAIRVIETDVRYSVNFDTTLNSPFSDPFGPDNSGAAWNFAGTPASSTNRALILETYATTANRQATTRQNVYQTGSFDCSKQIYNPKLRYVLIYFVRGGTLYRRTVTDDNTTSTCNGPQIQKHSCPTDATWTSVCQANDEVIATNVSAFSIDYYYGGSLLSVYPDDPNDLLPTADTALVTLTLSKGGGQTLTSTVSLSIAKVNNS